jgi:hypothetical protein
MHFSASSHGDCSRATEIAKSVVAAFPYTREELPRTDNRIHGSNGEGTSLLD